MNIMEAQRNVSISAVNGYTVEKTLIAEKMLAEFALNQRHFPLEKIVETYNTIRGTNVQVPDCKSCGVEKYITSIKNYAKYGRMTLINDNPNAFDVPVEDIKPQPQVIAPERIVTGIEDKVEEEPVEKIKEVKTKKSNAKNRNK